MTGFFGVPLLPLLPLEGTLPGWPPAQQPPLLTLLLICLLIPFAIGVVVTFLGKGAELVETARENGVAAPAVSAGGPERRALHSGRAATEQSADADAREVSGRDDRGHGSHALT